MLDLDSSWLGYNGASVFGILLGLASLVVADAMGLFRSKLKVEGKHCYVTGGSSGLGRALAIQLVKRGAHVTVIARGQAKLDETVAELKSLANSHQIVQSVSADLSNPDDSRIALERAAEKHGGRVPDEIYMCAGASFPAFFIDLDAAALKKGMDMTYWVQAWTAHAATKMMISQRIAGRVVFVASFLGYTTFAGYTNYSPGKYAIRGLADALRSELLQHDIAVHLYMPAGIDSPGYVEEQRKKPRITKKIEEDDVVLSAESVANSLIVGLEKGNYQITNLLITDLVRVKSCGPVPGNNVAYDTLLSIVSHIGLPIWRMITDRQVRKDAPAVHKELAERGVYKQ